MRIFYVGIFILRLTVTRLSACFDEQLIQCNMLLGRHKNVVHQGLTLAGKKGCTPYTVGIQNPNMY